MAPKRKHGILPTGVWAIPRPNGKVSYYWHPGRGTAAQGKAMPLPDDPSSMEFWREIERLKQNQAKPIVPVIGGFSRLVEAYLESPHFLSRSENTQREYRRYLENLNDTFGNFEPDEIEPKHLAALRDEIAKTKRLVRGKEVGMVGKANSTIKAFGALYAWGAELGYNKTNPAHLVSTLEGGEYEPWPEWAWTIAMESFRDDLRTACAIGLYTGQRIGDVLRMQLGHIKDNAIEVRQEKVKGNWMTIPLHSELRPLVARVRSRGHVFLVSKDNGAPFTDDQFHAAWGREMDKEPQGQVRQSGLVFHGLRKNAAVKLAEAGCTEHEIAAITGQSLQMVQHYTKRARQFRLALSAMEKVEGARG